MSLHQIIMSFIQDNFLEQKPPELDGMKFYWLTSALWFAFLRYLNMCCCRGCLKHHLILYRHLEPCISVTPWGQFLFRISAVWWYLWVLMRSSAAIFVSVSCLGPAGFQVWSLDKCFVQSFASQSTSIWCLRICCADFPCFVIAANHIMKSSHSSHVLLKYPLPVTATTLFRQYLVLCAMWVFL